MDGHGMRGAIARRRTTLRAIFISNDIDSRTQLGRRYAAAPNARALPEFMTRHRHGWSNSRWHVHSLQRSSLSCTQDARNRNATSTSTSPHSDSMPTDDQPAHTDRNAELRAC